MEDIDDTNKLSSLIVSFMNTDRIDMKVQLAYILTFQLTDDQKERIKDYHKVRTYCKKILTDEDFMRKLRKRLAVTEEAESVKYWDNIDDKFDDTYNYNKELEVSIMKVNMYLLNFVSRLLRELEIQNLTFSLGEE